MNSALETDTNFHVQVNNFLVIQNIKWRILNDAAQEIYLLFRVKKQILAQPPRHGH